MAVRTDKHATVITGAHIGVFRLKVLIKGAELEAHGMKLTRGASSLSLLKRALGLKGNRERVIEQAKEILANVANW